MVLIYSLAKAILAVLVTGLNQAEKMAKGSDEMSVFLDSLYSKVDQMKKLFADSTVSILLPLVSFQGYFYRHMRSGRPKKLLKTLKGN